MKILPLTAGCRIRMKKQHPCGGTDFRVLRVGAEVRILCEKCGRDMTLDRIRLEKSVRAVLPEPSDCNNKKGI